MTAWEVSLILFPLFIALILLRVPVAFALGLACVPVFLLEDRLTPEANPKRQRSGPRGR